MEDDEAVRIRVPWAGIAALPGRTFRSRWLEVAADRRVAFEFASYVDENEFRLAGFPEDLVEGFHLVSLLDHLANGALSIDDPSWTGLNYGLDRVRFVSPVRLGDRLRLAGSIRSVAPKGEAWVIALDCTIEVEGRERPAMVAEWLAYWSLA